MSIEPQGENLIFLISQPRAGSTLLQRILGVHPQICTASEPWLMLHPLYPLSNVGCKATYNAGVARMAMIDFFKCFPEGEEEYFKGVRRMYGGFYERALEVSGKCLFLDKTPRYYFIIPELYRTFPRAHFIFLFRNPLAVLCSIVKTWGKRLLRSDRAVKYDLLEAPLLLLKGVETLGQQGLTASYERLLGRPENEVEIICDWLGIEFVPSMLQYGRSQLPHWPLGDQKVYQLTQPDANIGKTWLSALNDPQIWRLANDYLEFLGKEALGSMGYAYEELRTALEDRRPTKARLWFTSSMGSFPGKPEKQSKSTD